jgi:hypothetical protein
MVATPSRADFLSNCESQFTNIFEVKLVLGFIMPKITCSKRCEQIGIQKTCVGLFLYLDKSYMLQTMLQYCLAMLYLVRITPYEDTIDFFYFDRRFYFP